MRKKRIRTALLAMAVLSLTACKTEQKAGAGEPADKQETKADETEIRTGETSFALTTKDGAEVTFDRVPERVLSMNVNTGDQLMALGLGDKILATANNNTHPAPEFQEEYEAIPQMGDKPGLEAILAMEPDFVYGRSSSFNEKYNTEHDTLSGYGIMSLSSIEGYKLGADVEDVYEDFYRLGRIFQVEERAEAIVEEMKEQIQSVEEAVEGREPEKVFVFDMAQEEGAYTCGNNFTSKLIEHAGGVNIFQDLDTTWATVSWEEVVERAPEVIVINDYGDASLEEKIAFLKETPALKTIPAVEQDRIISVTLCESFASSMTGDTVETFARAFHPDCFDHE